VNAELEKKSPSQPRSLLEPCLKKKKQAFELNIKNASAQLADQISFNLAAGEYALLIGEYTPAYNFYSKVALRDINNFEAQQWRYLAWSHMTKGTLATQKPEKYYSDLKYHLEAILKHPRAPTEVKEEAHWQLAEAARLMKKKDVAAQHLESVLSINSQNVKALLKLSDYYQQSGNTKAALTLYQNNLAKFKKLDDSTIIAFERWADILEKEKKYSSAMLVLQNAKKQFPNSPKINSLLARILAENKRFVEAQDLLSHTNAQQAGDNNQRIAQARIEEENGDKASKADQPGLALRHYQKALDLDSKQSTVRMKAAKLLYSYHQSRSFKKDEALTKDMDEAVRFLDPMYAINKMSAENFGLLIRVAEHSSSPERAVGACKRFEKTYGKVSPSSVLKACQNSQLAVDRRRLENDVSLAKKNIYNSTQEEPSSKNKGERAPASSLRKN